MSKKPTPKKRSSNKQTGKEKEKPPIIPEKYQEYFYVGLILLAVFIFFAPAILEHGFYVSDNIASNSFEKYVEHAEDQGVFPQWIPYIFSGMPSFAAMLTTGTRAWAFLQLIVFEVIGFVGTLFANEVARLAFYYFLYGLGIYLLMRMKDFERFVSFFSSIAAVFSTCVIVWIMIGHNTKPVVFATFPYVFLLMEKLRVKFTLLHAALLVVAIHIMMEAGHVQMIFYGICAFALYLIFELISRIVSKKEPLKIVKVAAVLAVAGGISFLMSADRYLNVLEYTPHSTRGQGPIVETQNAKQSSSGGNDYDYATMWSFSPEETIIFLVPNYFGFGKLEYSGPATRGESLKIPTYWGQKPFDDAAAYMGIAVFGLAIVGFILYRKNIFVQFLAVLSIFSLLLSFGKNLPVLYDFFYYYVPMFNKFRAPSMALALMQFAFPILAGFGLSGLMSKRKKTLDKDDKKMLKGILIAAIAFLGAGLIFAALFKSFYIDAVTGSANSSFQNILGKIQGLPEFLFDKTVADWLFIGVIALATAILIYYYVHGKISKGFFYVAIAALLFLDLWRVDYRPMDVSEKPIEEKAFQRTDVIDFIKSDKDNFRVVDLIQRESPNALAYFKIENVNGYHSAKLRVYQDLMDQANLPRFQGSTSTVFNPFLWSLLNVKYILASGRISEEYKMVFQSRQKQQAVFSNPYYLPRAFFVDSTAEAKPLEILKHIQNGDFNPRQVAFFDEEAPKNIESASNARVNGIETGLHHLKIEAEATGKNLLYISEIYYEPAWKAYIDGEPAKIYKTNYAFRSVVVPEGKHTIELKYESEAFETGKTLSIASNILVAILLIAGLFIENRKKK